MSRALAGVGLFVALSAFGLTGALSLRAQVEPLYAVLRSAGAFIAVLVVTRWSAGILDSLPAGGGPADRVEPRDDVSARRTRGRH